MLDMCTCACLTNDVLVLSPDLDIERLMKEAQFRWFRPNEVHAILSNYKHFKIQPQPVDRPKGAVVSLPILYSVAIESF